MRFKDVFSIIGPSMIGPSSSHTAGAVRIGRVARQALGGMPLEASIRLYGSFAETYRGHGTDVALVGGMLDFATDDEAIPDAFHHAEQAGFNIQLHTEKKPVPHPNTVDLLLRNQAHAISIQGCSIGGGNIEILKVDGFSVKFTAMQPTLLIFHTDRQGMVAEVSGVLRRAGVNIGLMQVVRESRHGQALTVIECDQSPGRVVLGKIGRMESVSKIRVIDLIGEDGGA
ncbi:L-serine ammonia-lyase, iron-sulfur-dependent subunit beta [Paenibacillus senegalimassiliensis]|uniref:L-serine ammonia-lyase, iron-sulfur-dependent subunit beta n=1 Tax=Paenibacillus senegalimassiliensis TaxID=1737426 RepID=UPI00073EB139|nr:L-serine ammonia-lyase, iron-sulfur-dependent subunit beta [Paenibacillus senegalimassiliensis]